MSIFPSNITIEECQIAADFKGFRINRKDDYIIFNYDYAFRGTFPNPNDAETEDEKRMLSIRRECRGLIFNEATGEIVARRFHKFFNVCRLLLMGGVYISD